MKNKRPSMEPVSDLTAGRLSVYLRGLTMLAAAGVKTTSSKALAAQFAKLVTEGPAALDG